MYICLITNSERQNTIFKKITYNYWVENPKYSFSDQPGLVCAETYQ